MAANVKLLVERVEELFGKRGQLMTFYQELAENFYPQRADFTVERTPGEVPGENLSTSYPLQIARELTDTVGQMLRPTEKPWFHITTQSGDRLDNEAKRWLERNEVIQRRAMYDLASLFTRATKEADGDFSVFGNAALSVRLNRSRDTLLYKTYHLRDMAWLENDEGKICLVARRWRPSYYDLVYTYKQLKVHEEIKRKVERHAWDKLECLHIVCDADMLESENPRGMPRFELFYDCEHKHEMSTAPTRHRHYIIPRWQTVAGSQYAYSPATVIGLPDARLLQAMTYTLLEAGEKITNPPMVATQDVVRSDLAIYPGGVTWVDAEYDEKLGAALRPLTTDAKGFPFGMDMQRNVQELLFAAFYLNKLQLPVANPQMTAFEVAQRIQEWIRRALPIFEPMESDYSGQLCEETYQVLFYGGAFGSPLDIPKSLRGRDLIFKFRSPLHDAMEQARGQKFVESKQLLMQAAELDPSSVAVLDATEALRDCLEGLGTPARWIRSENDVTAMQQKQAQQQQIEQMLANATQGSQAAANLSKAGVPLGAGAGAAVGAPA